MKKIINYLPFIVLLLLPLLFYPVVDTSGWRSSSDVHAFFEFASSLLAVTAGIMVLLHFFTTGRWFFLIISIGLGIVGTEQFVHAIFSFNRIWSEIHPTFKLAVSTTWLTGHFILLASFFLALIFGNKEIFPAKRGLSAVVYNIIGLIFAASATLLIFNSPFLPQFVQLGSITKKLIELSLALLYFVAFLSYSNIYFKQQSHSPLLWGIIAFIIFRVLAHIFVFDAKDFYDAHWDAAHLIVFLSYFFPIIGIWGETIKLHRVAQSQVIELKKEMVERKRAEDALRESRQKLITAQRIAKIGDFTWNLETGDVVWSDAMHDIIGYDKTEKIDYAKVNSEIHHPDDLVRITQWFNDCISSGKKELSQNEYRLIRKDGIIIYVRASVLVEHSEDKPITVFGMIQDITEQKQAKDVIKQNEVCYRYISETISDFAYSCIKIPGDEYAIDWMIGTTEHISGYTIDEIKAWGCWKNMVDPVHFPIFEDNMLNISPGTSSECELKIIRKDGVTRWLRCLTRCLLSDEDNTIHCLYGGCKDITEHKQIESKLQDSERKFRTLFENSRDA
ncbi:MAG: PAS domain S-box protein, partial [Deltaproteobacteria bacterium]